MERTIIIVCAEDEEDLDVEQSMSFAFWRMEIGAGETREENQGKRKNSWQVGKWPTGNTNTTYEVPSLVGF